MPIDLRLFQAPLEDRVQRMSALLAEQEALRRIANECATDSEAMADVSRQAGAVAVMLRHHIARLGGDVGGSPKITIERERALRKALCKRMQRRSPRPLVLNSLQRRLTKRLWSAFVRSEEEGALTDTLCRLSFIHSGDVGARLEESAASRELPEWLHDERD